MEVQTMLDNITTEDVLKPKFWRNLTCIVKLKPDNDILPVRGLYTPESDMPNIGINYLTTDTEVYYALADVIAAKLLSGKIPCILEAKRFIPRGVQKQIRTKTVLGVELNPRKDDVIKKLILKRKENQSQAGDLAKTQQERLKIIANTSCYGIFIEMNVKNESAPIHAYSDIDFDTEMEQVEETGVYFNPLLSVCQVAGSRLMLAIAEAYLHQKGVTHAYMDTDSIFVNPEYADELVALFQKLNPYNDGKPFLKKVKENVLFYGISSKRYVLYTLVNGQISIIDHKLHGLGHLLNPFGKGKDWQKEIWHDILSLHYEKISQQDIIEKYNKFYVLTSMTVSTPNVYSRFRKLNKDKPLSQQIKPFNFFLVGQGAIMEKDIIKPITPLCKNPQEAVYKPFIDYKTGKTLQGLEYWTPLDKIIFDYTNHPESKFDNGDETGIMRRRHIINPDLRHIGKEVKNEETTIEEESINELS